MLSRTSSRVLVLALFALGVGLAPPAGAKSKRHSDHGSHGFGGDRITGSGVLETRTLDLADFERVRIDGVADMTIRVGTSFSVELTAEDNLIDLVDVHVNSGELIVDQNEFQMDTEEGIQLAIEMPALTAIQVDGVGNVEIHGLDGEALSVQIDGVGNVSAEGSVGRLDLQVDGVGEVMFAALVAQDADVSLDGVGNVTIHVEKTLRAQVDGMGSLHYHGDPEIVRKKVDGFGRIVSLDS